FTWDFGDGTAPVVTTDTMGMHVFDTAGTYTVTLWAENGCGDAMAYHWVTVVACDPVEEVDFSWDPLTPTAGMTVTFEAMLVGTPTMPVEFTWDFGDGTAPVVTTATMGTHIFVDAGVYTVTLWAENQCGDAMVYHWVTVESGQYYVYLPLVLNNFGN
ncbi:MAG: PKD domain-containing protein, partial [Chloroflexia bacterium]|nr:PKD domain-containing protein [Chloroflexia bacterium]